MQNEDKKLETRAEASGLVYKLVRFLWRTLAEPVIFVLLMLVVFGVEMIMGFTDKGGVIMLVLWLAFFLTRISLALETIAKNTTRT